MIELIQLLKELGSTAIDLFWLPVAIWTGVALATAVVLNYATHLAAIYHYHIRAAVLAALPAGIIAAPLIHWILGSASANNAAALLVIQNPLTVTVSRTAQVSINWGDPALWMGMATLGIVLMAFAAVIKLSANFIQLKSFVTKLKGEPAEQIGKHITVYLSDAIETPCTFGYRRKSIVIPGHLKDQPEKYNMALRHELVHINHHDYLINNFVQIIKALFYFHPAVHYLTNQINEYREICCDIEVLSETTISQKSYAGLLYELASKPIFKNTPAVNMAVNSSTLKKRIQTMKNQTNITPSLQQSVIVAMLLGLTFTGFMACSDMTSDGLTTSEVKKMQKDIATSKNSVYIAGPIYFLNGEKLDNPKKISRIKPKYIKSIHVLKDKKAVEKYGKAGKNGVIKLQVYNKEKALNDLKSLQDIKNADLNTNDMKVYMASQIMPELKNREAFYTNLPYSQTCKKGTIIIQFTVKKSGKTTGFNILKGINDACNQATLAYVKTHAEFSPGTQDGQPVNVQMALPIRYQSN